MKTIVNTMVASLFLVSASAFAQESSFHRSRLVAELDMHQQQPLRESALREGRLLAVKDFSQAAQKPPRNTGKRMLIGALVGAGAGFVVMSLSPDCTQPGGYCGPFRLIGVGIGAGVGAAIGAFVGG